jgi:shikimate dehydrogenase
VIYGKNTPFIKKAKEFNLLSKGGKDMLAYQGAIAFNLFNSNSLNEDKIVNVMKEALKLPSFH